MVAQVSRNVRDTDFRSATRSWIGEALNRAHRTLCDEVRAASPNFFLRSTTIAVVAGTNEYDLPLDCPTDGLREVTPLQAGYPRSRPYMRWRDRAGVISGPKQITTYHNGRRLRLILKPDPTEAETVTVGYQRGSVEMQYGTPVSMTATSIRLAAAPDIGNTYLHESAIVGGRIFISAGSSIGMLVNVTAFAPATRIATIDGPFTAFGSPSTHTYEVVPEFMDDSVADFCVHDATVQYYDREEDDATSWKEARARKLAAIKQSVMSLQKVEALQLRLDRDRVNLGHRYRLPDQHYR